MLLAQDIPKKSESENRKEYEQNVSVRNLVGFSATAIELFIFDVCACVCTRI